MSMRDMAVYAPFAGAAAAFVGGLYTIFTASDGPFDEVPKPTDDEKTYKIQPPPPQSTINDEELMKSVLGDDGDLTESRVVKAVLMYADPTKQEYVVVRIVDNQNRRLNALLDRYKYFKNDPYKRQLDEASKEFASIVKNKQVLDSAIKEMNKPGIGGDAVAGYAAKLIDSYRDLREKGVLDELYTEWEDPRKKQDAQPTNSDASKDPVLRFFDDNGEFKEAEFKEVVKTAQDSYKNRLIAGVLKYQLAAFESARKKGEQGLASKEEISKLTAVLLKNRKALGEYRKLTPDSEKQLRDFYDKSKEIVQDMQNKNLVQIQKSEDKKNSGDKSKQNRKPGNNGPLAFLNNIANQRTNNNNNNNNRNKKRR